MVNEEIIQEIVRRVLSQLGGTAAPAARQTPAPGPVLEPLAPTREARRDVPPVPAPAPRPNPLPARRAPAKRVFVTAEMLVGRIGADHTVTLVEGEQLTPNAEDYVERHNVRVLRAEVPAGAGPVAAPGAVVLPPADAIGLVVHDAGRDHKVASTLTALGREGLAMPRFAPTDCWMRNSAALCKAIAAGEVGGGVVLVPSAAGAVVFASKYRGVRAFQAASADEVAEAVREFDANVLVVDHARASFFEMRTLIKTFIEHRRRPRTGGALLEALARVEGKAQG